MKLICVELILTLFSLNNRDVVGNVKPNYNVSEVALTTDGSKLKDGLTYGNQQCPPLAAIVCKDSFVQLGSHCFHFCPRTETWPNALKSCRDMGTTLAYPLNPHENTLLVNYLKKNFGGVDYWWLGASDYVNEGQWFWAHSKCPIAYADWAGAQPDNNGNVEDCLHMNKRFGWKWNDVPCSNQYRYICQQ